MMPLLCPGLLLISSLLPAFFKKKEHLAILSTQSIMIALLITTLFFAYHTHGPANQEWTFLQYNQIKLTLGIQWDTLAKVMMLFILTIGFFIYNYAQNYLLNDQTRTRFLSQFNLVLCSVLLLVISSNLLTAFVAWQLIGINLYLLLNHYHHDPEANRAAKKKFVINRIGDCTFLLAIALAYHTNSAASFASIQASPLAETICILLFISVMTKCAQFPFHIWLIDTMEAPTPVSALMHAGVINAGGILLTRISQTLTTFQGLSYFILTIGLISALLSIHWMNQQPDTKKKLAYSTMGQMGYMIAQCSLGAFPAVIFHLISHGFYKASLFLNAGETLLKSENTTNEKSNYTSILRSYLITSIMFFIGLSLFHTNKLDTPILVYGFIFLSLTTLIFKIDTLNTVKFKNKLSFYLLISLMFFAYLFIFHTFSNLLLSYEYKGQISHFTQYSILALLVFFQIYSWTKNSSTRLVYRDQTETFFRKYLLTPLRFAGSLINQKKTNRLTSVLYKFMMIIMLLFFSIGFFYAGLGKQQASELYKYIVFSCLTTGILALIAANRCSSIKSLMNHLILYQITFVNIALFNQDSKMFNVGLFHLINAIPILFMVGTIAGNKNTQKTAQNIQKIGQPSQMLYLSFSLLLLIGIPGTATFVSEIYLLNALINYSFIFALLYIATIILMAIVIMHSLQIYVFKKSDTDSLAIKTTPREHWFFLLTIGLNLFCGLYPSLLLNYL